MKVINEVMSVNAFLKKLTKLIYSKMEV